ncbi:MAG: class B sortase [Anaerotruncus massiliensis (ex Togo et al. 2019)]
MGNRNELSQNTIIYGHSMSDTIRDDPEQDKFTQLKKYLDIEWAKKHPYIYFSTAEDDMTWKVFAVSYVDTKLSYNLPEYKDQNFNELIAELKDRSQFDIDVDVTPSDKILILSTCTYPTGYTNKAIDEATVPHLRPPGPSGGAPIPSR